MLARRAFLCAAGAAALFSATLATSPAAEARCRGYVSGWASGPQPLRALTGVAARAEWRKEVTARYGASYAWWSRSDRRYTRCVLSDGTWHCHAKARPCRR